ncbi:MAG: hypothetical protein GXP37_04150 [Chloroflexi bacterium]|nr:hypothetical protein [Chloroflexota bacterium]
MNKHKFSGLIADLELGKQSLVQIMHHHGEVLARKDQEPAFFLTSAAGVVLHDFYNTVEKTFQQIALEVDGSLPAGDSWHQQLLRRMTVGLRERRPPIIDESLAQALSEYLRFRHLFRHIYGFELIWERIEPLFEALPTIHDNFVKQLDAFIAYLQTLQED